MLVVVEVEVEIGMLICCVMFETVEGTDREIVLVVKICESEIKSASHDKKNRCFNTSLLACPLLTSPYLSSNPKPRSSPAHLNDYGSSVFPAARPRTDNRHLNRSAIFCTVVAEERHWSGTMPNAGKSSLLRQAPRVCRTSKPALASVADPDTAAL